MGMMLSIKAKKIANPKREEKRERKRKRKNKHAAPFY
jgi:hypothetical protein